MAGFGNKLLNNAIRNNIFEQITKYIVLCCETMINDLKKENVFLPNDENKIRNYLLENYLDDNLFRKINNMQMFRFDSENAENYDPITNTYKGRVDIKIVNKNDCFEERAAAYFVECKRIDGGRTLNTKYVIDGIKRFVSVPQQYSSYYGRNFMLGFVVKDIGINDNVYLIDETQIKDAEIKVIAGMKKVSVENAIFDCEYEVNNNKVILRHIFSNLSENIE